MVGVAGKPASMGFFEYDVQDEVLDEIANNAAIHAEMSAFEAESGC